VFQSLCNECSNCDVYCPQQGAPFKLKEQVFFSLDSFRAALSLNGFCRQGNTLHARVGGVEMLFVPQPEHNRALVRREGLLLELQWEPLEVKQGHVTLPEGVTLDSALLWRMKTVWESIFNSSKPNMVNPDPPAGRSRRSVEERMSTGGTT
jgi:hypothetical protein